MLCYFSSKDNVFASCRPKLLKEAYAENIFRIRQEPKFIWNSVALFPVDVLGFTGVLLCWPRCIQVTCLHSRVVAYCEHCCRRQVQWPAVPCHRNCFQMETWRPLHSQRDYCIPMLLNACYDYVRLSHWSRFVAVPGTRKKVKVNPVVQLSFQPL